MKEMPEFLVHDLVVMEDVCNGHCQYCLTGSSKLKSQHLDLMQQNTLTFHMGKLLLDENSYSDNSPMQYNLDRIVDIFDQKKPHILKISGGEILLTKNILSFVKKHQLRFKRIQILTNGTLLNEELLKQIKGISNASLQISMDGHLLEMNRYRNQDERVQERLCDMLRACHSLDIPVEINCVLTNANLHMLHRFAEFLQPYTNVLLLPYPVRGPLREPFYPGVEQLEGLYRLLDRFDDYRSILPPRAYLMELEYFLVNGINRLPCSIPSIIYQIFDDGDLTPCPNIWFKKLGNVIQDSSQEVLKKLNHDPIYHLMQRKSRILTECKMCFTPWEILNLFLIGKISMEELSRIHLFNHPESLCLLQSRAVSH